MRMTEAQVEQYRRDGYLIFPSLFMPAEIAVLRAETARLSGAPRRRACRRSRRRP